MAKILLSLLLAICISSIKKILFPDRCNFFTRYKMSFDYHDGLGRSCLKSYFFRYISVPVTFLFRECLRREYLNARYRWLIFLVSVSLRLPRDRVRSANDGETNLSCGTEKVFEKYPSSLLRKSFLACLGASTSAEC